MSQESKTSRVWLITGTSSGFGARFVTQLLQRGDRVIATARTLSKVETKFPTSENLRLLHLDITDDARQIASAIGEAMSFWGRIDVLVNNAGSGVLGLVEEHGASGMESQMQSNFIGTLNVINGTLPHMRHQKSGTIVIIGSRSSWAGEAPSRCAYAASKAAMRVMGEALSVELAQFNIRILIVEPAAFNTEGIWASPLHEGDIADYNELREQIRQWKKASEKVWLNDPIKGVKAIIDVVTGEGFAAGREWPLYLPLGEAAVQAIQDKTQKMQRVIDEWHDFIVDMSPDDAQICSKAINIMYFLVS